VNVIPADAVLAVSLTTDPKQWQNLREFGTSATQLIWEQNFRQLRDRLLTNNGSDFQTDIQPWVGDVVTVAVLAEPGGKTSLVMVLPLKNPETAKDIFAQPKFQKPGEWVDRVYQGITIKETQKQTGDHLSAAFLDHRFLVITNHPQAIEKVIDTEKSKVSLATSPGFSDNFAKITTFQPFAQFYLNVPIAARITDANPNQRLPSQVLTQLENNQGLAGTITLETAGINLKGISWLNPHSQRVLTVDNKAGNMEKHLPGSTLMMLSGVNLQKWWSDYTSTSEGNPLSPITPDELRRAVKSLTNLDLERDWLNWMQGEFSIAVIPNSPKPNYPENFRAGLVLMVQASDRQGADKALTQLDAAMQNQYKFKIESGTVAGKPVINWVSPFGTLTATHGWLDGDISFFALGSPVSEQIISSSENPLVNSNLFSQAVPQELHSPNGELFWDVEQTLKSFTFNSLLFPNQQAFLETTRTIGVKTSVEDNRSTRFDIFLALKKMSPQPNPTPPIKKS
jgi:hypothetical protein